MTGVRQIQVSPRKPHPRSRTGSGGLAWHVCQSGIPTNTAVPVNAYHSSRAKAPASPSLKPSLASLPLLCTVPLSL